MISQDTIQKIQRLKGRRFTQENVAQQLGLSRSTVARHWGGRKGISVEEEVSTVMAALKYYFQIGKCPDCGMEIISLYKKQFDFNKEQHEKTHKED